MSEQYNFPKSPKEKQKGRIPLFIVNSIFRELSRPLFRNASYLMINTVVVSTVGMGASLLATHLYLPGDVGKIAGFISASQLVTTVSILGLGPTLIRYLPGGGPENASRLINFAFTLTPVVALLAGSIYFWTFTDLFQSLEPRQLPGVLFYLLFMVVVLSLLAHQMVDQTLIAGRQPSYVVIKNSVSSTLRLLLIVVLPTTWGALSLYAAFGASMLLGALVGLFWLIPKTFPEHRFEPVINPLLGGGIPGYSGGNYLANLVHDLPFLVLPQIVILILGAQSGGYFSIAWLLGNSLTMPFALVATSLFVEASHDEGRLTALARKALVFSVVGSLGVAIGALLLGNYALALFGENYAKEGSSLLRILAILVLPTTINYILVSVLRVLKQMTAVVLAYSFMAIIALTLAPVLMRAQGITGVGWMWGIAQIGGMTVLAFGLKRHPTYHWHVTQRGE